MFAHVCLRQCKPSRLAFFWWLACLGCDSASQLKHSPLKRLSQYRRLPSRSRSGALHRRRPLDAIGSVLFALLPSQSRPRSLLPLRRPEILMQVVGDVDFDFADECDEGLPMPHGDAASSQAGAAVVSPFAKDEEQAPDSSEAKAEQVTVTLEPGRLGLNYTDAAITEIIEGGQAHRVGLEVGWRIVGINGEECTSLGDERVLLATQGDQTFQLTFEKAEPQTTLPLTEEAVEAVLNEVRPYLLNDGGNVKLRGINDGVVTVELEGACSGCPSSAMTMKMGIENNLKTVIPEIKEVVQVAPEGEALSIEAVDAVLEEVRPFIKMADKEAILEVASIEGSDAQPVVKLRLTSKIGVVKSVKVEIASRIQRKFPNPPLRIEWLDK